MDHQQSNVNFDHTEYRTAVNVQYTLCPKQHRLENFVDTNKTKYITTTDSTPTMRHPPHPRLPGTTPAGPQLPQIIHRCCFTEASSSIVHFRILKRIKPSKRLA